MSLLMEATAGNKDMPVGGKSLWEIHDPLYGDDRTGSGAFESRPPFEFTPAVVLPNSANVSLLRLFGHKPGSQGGMGGMRIRQLDGKAPA